MITATLIDNETARLDITYHHFGFQYPLLVEPTIYNIASKLSQDYDGGFWNFYELSNGGFFQAPTEDYYVIQCPNDYRAVVTGYEFGIIVCLYTYSSLSFNTDIQNLMADHYHLLRPFAFSLENCDKIVKAVD